MICGLLAARKLLGRQVDPWAADADTSYQEERPAAPPGTDRHGA